MSRSSRLRKKMAVGLVLIGGAMLVEAGGLRSQADGREHAAGTAASGAARAENSRLISMVGAERFGGGTEQGTGLIADAGGAWLSGRAANPGSRSDPAKGRSEFDGDPPPGVDCPANSLLSQPPDEPQFFTAYTSEESANLRRFEKFSGVGGAIEGLRWFGLDLQFTGGGFIECVEPDPTFAISFHEDAAGVPGKAVRTYVLLATRTPTGISYQGTELNQYDLTLPEPCVLVHGWVSIVGLGSPSCWFLWMSGLNGDQFSYCDNCQSPVQNDDLSYCLVGTPGGIFGACCNESNGLCSDGVEISNCTAVGTRFVPNETCARLDPPCTIVTGACCLPNGVCNVDTFTACAAAKGNWLGGGSVCDQCPPVGACCIDFETCLLMTEPNCQKAGAAWLGTGSVCADCPPAPQCPANSLFAQPPEGPDSFLAGTSEANANLRRYENFSGVAGAIESLVWWGLDLDYLGGSTWAECAEQDTTFEISFHEDAGGVPGAAVCAYTVLATRTPLNILYLGAELNQYEATLPTPCVMTSGWVSIVGLGDGECWFLWMSSGVGDSYCQNCLPPPQGVDLSVCLIGTVGGIPGACCNDATGLCNDGVDIANCIAPGQSFAPNQTCGELDPPCGTVLGACCFTDATCTFIEQGDCSAAGGLWLGANSLCTNCPCYTPCPVGGANEGEATCGPGYVDDFNGGCTASMQVFSPIAAGVPVCGTSGVFENPGDVVADFDWYQLNVPAMTTLTWTATAEFRPRLWIVKPGAGGAGCPGTILVTSAALECQELTIAANVQPGIHWLVIAPNAFTDSAACGARYVATVTWTLECAGDIVPPDGDGHVNVSDLLAVINAWGPCPAPPLNCPADVNDDGQVNVSDLLAVINSWGACWE